MAKARHVKGAAHPNADTICNKVLSALLGGRGGTGLSMPDEGETRRRFGSGCTSDVDDGRDTVEGGGVEATCETDRFRARSCATGCASEAGASDHGTTVSSSSSAS